MATPTPLPSTFVAGNVLTAAQMNNLRGAFRVLQVVSTTKTDAFSGTIVAASELEITGLNVTITPSSTSSRILVFAMCTAGDGFGYFFLKRGSTKIAIGDAAGSRSRATTYGGGQAGEITMIALDSPNTTSATTYTVFVQSGNTNNVGFNLNRTAADTDNIYFARMASSITVLEISA